MLAWAFVAARVAHSYVHVTTNRIRIRRPLFILGYFINLLLWLLLAFHIA